MKDYEIMKLAVLDFEDLAITEAGVYRVDGSTDSLDLLNGSSTIESLWVHKDDHVQSEGGFIFDEEEWLEQEPNRQIVQNGSINTRTLIDNGYLLITAQTHGGSGLAFVETSGKFPVILQSEHSSWQEGSAEKTSVLSHVVGQEDIVEDYSFSND